ncbi:MULTISPECIES: ferredoxin [unclassified Beijerinckia]|uniref:ferredoxin n=1 Tax=unclassified Beijerinckia TaxID=2638183 RepID=UPI00089C946F|nr:MULTISPECIES: ferredoxin [unclassified Beijerinckia]MDH7797059.1 ferredoxin [Beijerinckia sp. GAS462]SEC70605.1 ferredoxin [Beijerinckia sp. 28-YEA-48]
MIDKKWNVSVDPEVCDGYAVCQRIEKSIFQYAEDDEVVRITSQPETPEVLERVKLAVRRCPKQALKLQPRDDVE